MSVVNHHRTTHRLPLADLDATEQAHLVRTGELSALSLVDAAIARIEALNPEINAIVASDFERARERARRVGTEGGFAGVPTLIKDLLAYPGLPTGCGSRLFQGQIAASGSDYTEALDAGGLIVLGKSATSEFGLLGTTEPLAQGATRNPWQPTRSPGGSSGGAVAAVASGMVPVAHASDGGGSIRGPASFCGLFGFKPSRGRTLSTGLPPGMPTSALLSDHCVSRSVRDSATWLRITEKPGQTAPLPAAATLAQTALPRLRIGFYQRDAFGALPSREALDALDVTTRLCQSLGHEIVEIRGPQFDAILASDAFFTLTGLTLAGLFDQLATSMGNAFDITLFEPYTQYLVERTSALSPADIQKAIESLTDAGREAGSALDHCDLLLSPTVPFSAFPLGQYDPTQNPQTLMAQTNRLAGYTVPASLAGWPAMSVPLYWTEDDLPIGSHFAAAPGRDERLFRLAFQLEAAAPWQPRLQRLREGILCRNA